MDNNPLDDLDRSDPKIIGDPGFPILPVVALIIAAIVGLFAL